MKIRVFKLKTKSVQTQSINSVKKRRRCVTTIFCNCCSNRTLQTFWYIEQNFTYNIFYNSVYKKFFLSQLVFEKMVFKVRIIVLKSVEVASHRFFVIPTVTECCTTFWDIEQNVTYKMFYKNASIEFFSISTGFWKTGVQSHSSSI